MIFPLSYQAVIRALVGVIAITAIMYVPYSFGQKSRQKEIDNLSRAVIAEREDKQKILDGYNAAALSLKTTSAALAQKEEEYNRASRAKASTRIVEYRSRVGTAQTCTLSQAAFDTIKETIRD